MSFHRLIASGRNATVQIFLDRWDYETYTVSIHRDGEKTHHEDFDSMVRATHYFFTVCDENGIVPEKCI